MKPNKRKPSRKEKFQKGREEAVRKKQADQNQIFRKWPLILIALCSFALYANTLGHEFALDDYSVILENRLTKQGLQAIPEIFTTSYRYGYFTSDDELYRPLPKAMFTIEWAISPGDPFPGHLMNVITYMLTGIFLFIFLLLLTRQNLSLSLVVTLLFVFHPIHTEVVANIKSRDELLAMLFGVLSMTMFLRYLNTSKVKFLALSSSFLLLGFLSKESTITLLAIFPCLVWIRSNPKNPSNWKGLVPVFVTAAIYLLLRNSVLNDQVPGAVSIADNLLSAAGSASEKFSTAIMILGIYLKKMVFPHPLIFDHSYNHIPLTGPGNWKVILSAIAHIGILVLGIKSLYRRELIGFGIMFYLFTMSIYSNLFVMIGSSFAERFLFMPSLGFCLVLGIIFVKGFKSASTETGIENPKSNGEFSLKTTKGAILVVILLLFGFKTVSRNPVWKNNLSLYSNDVKLAPNSTRTQYYLGNLLVKPESWGQGDSVMKDSILTVAIGYLDRSIAIFPDFADAYVQKGVAYYHKKNYEKALSSYNKALTLNPADPVVNNNIGTILFETGQYQKSLEYFLNAIQYNSAYAEAYLNAGSAYGVMQNYEMAIQYFESCLRYDPAYAQAYYFLGVTYQNMGNEPMAKVNFDKARSLGLQ